MIFNMVSGTNQTPTPPEFYPSLFVTGLKETDTCTATCNGKSFVGEWVTKGTNLLPSEYQEVEYIESSGTQYIDTGVIAKYGHNFKFSASCADTSNDNAIIGSYNGSLLMFPLMMTSGKHYAAFNTSGWSVNGVGSYSVNTQYEYEVDIASGAQYIKQNGTSIGTYTNSTAISTTRTYYLLGLNYNGTFTKGFSGKLYYMQIKDGGTLIRNFIPCYRKSDNVIGMYDTVNDVFYTNAGSGSFAKGADINQSGFLFSNLTELGTYIVSNGTSTMAILIDAPIEYTLEWSTIPRNGLVAEYLFDGDTLDTSPNGNDLTNSGVTFSNNAGVFNGSAYAQASNGVIPTNSPFSISLWAKTTGTSNMTLLGGDGGSSRDGLVIDLYNSKPRFLLANGGSDYPANVQFDKTVTDGLWHHIVATWTGDTTSNGIKMYVDGVLISSATSTGKLTSNSVNLNVGERSINGTLHQARFTGSLDNIRIYNRVLTDVEIEALFNEGGNIAL